MSQKQENPLKNLFPESCSLEMHATVVVGEKGQVVIPKNVRDQIGIQPGDTLMTVVKHGMAVGFIKTQDVAKVMKYLDKEMKS